MSINEKSVILSVARYASKKAWGPFSLDFPAVSEFSNVPEFWFLSGMIQLQNKFIMEDLEIYKLFHDFLLWLTI